MKIIECPRDAMQGLSEFIPTEQKVNYINHLLKVGFDTIDVGSFVSPKAIPQMRDTAEVLAQINWTEESSKLLTIVANVRGAEDALKWNSVAYLGFPLSISETFQQRNTNRSIAEALTTVAEIQKMCLQTSKQLVIYISMGFGNPYGDPYDKQTVLDFVHKLNDLGIGIISLADTVGVASIEGIDFLFSNLIKAFPHIELGAHLHANPQHAQQKIAAAYHAGCNRFDGALLGFGGCPMAEHDLVGNIPTELIVQFLEQQGISLDLNKEALQQAMLQVNKVFPDTH